MVNSGRDRLLEDWAVAWSSPVFKNRRIVTADGLESMFATNYLGPFWLTNLLLDKLKSNAVAQTRYLAPLFSWQEQTRGGSGAEETPWTW